MIVVSCWSHPWAPGTGPAAVPDCTHMYAVHDTPFSATHLLYYENKCSTDPHGQTITPKMKNGKIMQKRMAKKK